MSYEYKVIPAPARGMKAKGVKTPQDRFAHALETAINDLADQGWEYIRADTLPCEQREGLMSKTTTYQNMLVFRRAAKIATQEPMRPVAAPRPKPAIAAPVAVQPVPAKVVAPPKEPVVAKPVPSGDAE